MMQDPGSARARGQWGVHGLVWGGFLQPPAPREAELCGRRRGTTFGGKK